MDVYAGLDVHATSCTAVLRNTGGKTTEQKVLATNGGELVQFFKAQRGRVHLCIEEGTQSAWLWEVLSPHVFEMVVVGVTEKQRGAKDDARDAGYWAEQLRLGAIKQSVYKEVGPFATLRQLVKAHRAIVQDTVRIQNRIKAIFRSRGVTTSGQDIYAKKKRAEWLDQLPLSCRGAAGLLYDSYDGLQEQRKAAQKTLVTESHRHGISRILETCPGLGEIRVAQLLATVVSPHRFRTRHQFWAYCGLGIVMRSSSDWVQEPTGRWVKAPVTQTRGLNWNHNRLLKHVFKGAATTVIALKQEPMNAAYERLCREGVKPNLAKVTIARKIAATSLAMWKTQEEYQPDKSKPKG